MLHIANNAGLEFVMRVTERTEIWRFWHHHPDG
jgi:hypothetical protein